MGSDCSPQILLDFILMKFKELPEKLDLILLVQKGSVTSIPQTNQSFKIIECEQVVEMDENPLLAVRRKKNSTIAVGLKLVKEKIADAFVSAGNTGALMAMAKFQLSLINPIKRPALLAELPTEKSSVCMLDVGANVSCLPEHLVQFAQIGALYQKVMHKNYLPKIGLLNIGTESLKGTDQLKKVYQNLDRFCQKNKNHMQFCGNIEGTDVFKGKVDVLVTDGFTGNIFLKAVEGVSGFILGFIEHLIINHKKEAEPLFNDMQKYLNYAEYFGAVLAGINGLVIKVHGYSSPQAFLNGIKGACRLVDANFIHEIKENLFYH
jgi:glycerol-3-phosphate acyltransferase PlsX